MKKCSLYLLFCLPISFCFSQDLVITNVGGPYELDRYAEFNKPITVKNQGIVATGFNLNVILSTDNIVDNEDQIVTSYFNDLLAPFGEITFSTPMFSRLNVSAGSYYLLVIVDPYNNVSETNEENNLFVVPNFIVNAPSIDLITNQFSTIKSSFAQNEPIIGSINFTNTGLTNLGTDIDYGYVLSTDPTLSADDVNLESNLIRPIGPDSFTASIYDVYVPAVSPGAYFLLLKLDYFDRIEETNEGNNISAIPITITSSDVDLAIDQVWLGYYTPFSYDFFLSIRNSGTTAAGPINIESLLIAGSTGSEYYLSTIPSYNQSINASTSTTILISHYLPSDLPPDNYSIRFRITGLSEANYDNNSASSPSFFVGAMALEFLSASFADVYDVTETQLTLNLQLKNTGTSFTSNDSYFIEIRDAGGNQVIPRLLHHAFLYAAPGETQTVTRIINLPSGLSPGNYTVSLYCAYQSCKTTPASITGNLVIVPAQMNLSGVIQGEDLAPLSTGKLFLYQKDTDGSVRFTQKIEPVTSQNFSFPVNKKQHTLYFIPELGSGYLPTVFGGTTDLQPSSFLSITQDTTVLLQVLKLLPGAAGQGVINGQLVSGSSNARLGIASRTSSGNAVADAIVILNNASGSPVAWTITDAEGRFEFTGLPQAAYQVSVIDQPQEKLDVVKIPIDITTSNLNVTLEISGEEIEKSEEVFLLSQNIAFAELPNKVFGDPAFVVDASSSSGLILVLSSSNPAVASVNGSTITITGAGQTTITAQQIGNNFYAGAPPLSRELLVAKAGQTISFDDLTPVDLAEGSINLTATATSILNVAFQSSDPSVASVSESVLSLHEPGIVLITATQSGNSNYLSATPVSRELIIQKIVGVTEEPEITIYPNPTSEYLEIITDEPEVESSILNSYGQDFGQKKGMHLDIRNLTAGVYALKIKTNAGITLIRFIKN